MKNVIEALLFATDTSLAIDKIKEICEIEADEIRRLVEELNAEYEAGNRSFRIKEIAGGFQLYTLPEYAPWIKALYMRRVESRLSKAALETLAIVAYNQPVTRAAIERLRGVDSTGVIATLIARRLVNTDGRIPGPGRALKYVTTKEFLRYFGLKDLDDLPKMEEFFPDALKGEAEDAGATENSGIPV